MSPGNSSRHLIVGVALLVCLSALGCSDPIASPSQKEAIARVEQNAEALVAHLSGDFEPPPAALAELDDLCAVLRDLSPDSYEEVCAQSFAYGLARARIAADSDRVGAGSGGGGPPPKSSVEPGDSERARIDPPRALGKPEEAGRSAATSWAATLEPDERRLLENGIKQRVRELSLSIEDAALLGDLRGRLAAEARLNVLYRALQKASPNKALAGSEPLVLASRESLEKVLDTLLAKQRQLERVAAFIASPEDRLALSSVRLEIDRVNEVLSSDRPGLFHRARDSIGGRLDVEGFNKAIASFETDAKAERERLFASWKGRFPGDGPALLGVPLDPSPKPPGGPGSRSGRVLTSFRHYFPEPDSWLRSEAALRAEYFELRSLPEGSRPRPSFGEWKVAQLTDFDLARALRQVVGDLGSMPETPLGSTADKERRHLVEAENLLRAQIVRRAKEGGAGAGSFGVGASESVVRLSRKFEGPAALDLDSRQLRIAASQSATARYGGVGEMPFQMRELVVSAWRETLTDYYERAKPVAESLVKNQDRAARSTAPLGGELASDLAEARSLTRDAVQRLKSLYAAAPLDSDVGLARTHVQLDKWLRVLGGNSQLREAGAGLSTGLDAVFERRLGLAKEAVAAVVPKLKQVDVKVPRYASMLGRRVLPRQAANTRFVDARSVGVSRKSRLPETLADYRGRRDPATKRPYDYAEVRRFSRLSPLGGGIHFGAWGKLSDSIDLEGFTLRYDGERRELRLEGPNGERFVYRPISPATLKALYRYARTDQNLAVSVGWSGSDEVYEAQQTDESPVLLDPTFVDTRVGQDLTLADMLPWRLDERTLPGGIANPIAAEAQSAFEQRKRVRASEIERIEALVPSTATLRQAAEAWRDRADRRLYPHEVFARAILLKEDRRSARREAEIWLGIRQVSSSTGSEYPSDYEELLEQLRQRSPSSSDPLDPDVLRDILSPQQNDPVARMRESLRDLERRQNDRIDRARKAEFAEQFRFFDGLPAKRADALLELGLQQLTSRKMPRHWILTLAAALREADPDGSRKGLIDWAKDDSVGIESERIAELIYDQLRGRLGGLGVMMDRPTVITLEEGRISLEGSLELRYATRRIVVDSVGVRVDEERDAEELEQMSEVATRGLDAIAELHPPLRRVAQYAEIVSFLRWATSTLGTDALDFTDLGRYASHDPRRTPTFDAIER